jgi:hypothetical protein
MLLDLFEEPGPVVPPAPIPPNVAAVPLGAGSPWLTDNVVAQAGLPRPTSGVYEPQKWVYFAWPTKHALWAKHTYVQAQQRGGEDWDPVWLEETSVPDASYAEGSFFDAEDEPPDAVKP